MDEDEDWLDGLRLYYSDSLFALSALRYLILLNDIRHQDQKQGPKWTKK